jgi:hypothetical protein
LRDGVAEGLRGREEVDGDGGGEALEGAVDMLGRRRWWFVGARELP